MGLLNANVLILHLLPCHANKFMAMCCAKRKKKKKKNPPQKNGSKLKSSSTLVFGVFDGKPNHRSKPLNPPHHNSRNLIHHPSLCEPCRKPKKTTAS